MGDSRSITLVGDYLEKEARTNPALKDAYTQLNAAVQKKLWHQVSVQLLSYLTQPAMSAHLLALQEHVVSKLYKKLAPLSYVRWSIAVANLVGGGGNVAAGAAHLESVLPHLLHQTAGQVSQEQDEQAVLLLQLELARRQLSLAPQEQADPIKERLADSKRALDRYAGVMDARVYSAYYQAVYEFAKITGNPQDYYTHALLYLTYTPLTELPLPTQQALASDIGLAALLGKNIYNFGELLQHPILASLDSTEYAWLPKLLRAFNAGNIPEFNTIFEQVKGKYPTLASNSVFLNQKLRIMTLMELVFRLPSGRQAQAASEEKSAAAGGAAAAVPRGRTLSFDAIAKGCDLPKDQVEWLLMKALSLKVIKGAIDEVDESVRLTWVAPRVLDREQVQQLTKRVAAWQGDVEQTTVFVESNAQQVL